LALFLYLTAFGKSARFVVILPEAIQEYSVLCDAIPTTGANREMA
jgi:hypothetical protein